MHLSNVKVMFLPPNTTPQLQPCNAGIIAHVKTPHHNHLLHHILTAMDDANSAVQTRRNVSTSLMRSHACTLHGPVSVRSASASVLCMWFPPDDEVTSVSLVRPARSCWETWHDYVAMMVTTTRDISRV